MRTIGHWVGGATVSGGPVFAKVWQPATGQPQAQVAMGGQAEVDLAVASAAKAFDAWAETSRTRRAGILFAMRDLVQRHEDDLARLITAEHGKTLDDARGEVIRGREVIDFACGIANLMKGAY